MPGGVSVGLKLDPDVLNHEGELGDRVISNVTSLANQHRIMSWLFGWR